MKPDDEPRDELIKEVFARFGTAYYESECLYRGLCNLYVLATFKSKSDITGPRIEEKFSKAFKITLGKILDEIKGLLPYKLFDRLQHAVNSRNFLAHHFWFERCHLMFSKAGLEKILSELLKLEALFDDLDKEIETFIYPKIKEFGIEDFIQKAFSEALAGKAGEWEPLMTRRPLKKRKRILRAWDVQMQEGTALIFQFEDGSLWQFCDVGLGWTRYEKLGPKWRANKLIQKYLPAAINPRPKIIEPWNYELTLAKGAVLWVKKGIKEKTFKWGIRLLQ